MGLTIHGPNPKAGLAETIIRIVFALAFCAIGFFCLAMAAIMIFEGNLRKLIVAAPMGLAFSGFGIFFLISLFSARAKGRYLDKARENHPEEPWLWRKEWAGGKIDSRSRLWLKFVWAFALLWNTISLPLAGMIPKILQKGGGEVVLFSLFPVVGIGLLIWAAERTLRWKKFGRAVLELDTFPGVIGGELRGVVKANAGFAPRSAVRIGLRCLQSDAHSESGGETILWRTEVYLPPDAVRRGVEGPEIPFVLTIPYTCQPSSPEDETIQTIWRLRVRADLPRLDFTASFDVPVFLTPNSKESIMEDPGEARRTIYQDGEWHRFSPEAAIGLKKPSPGECRIYFPANRTPRMAFFLGFTTIIIGLVVWGLMQTDAPRFFPIMFGAFGALFLLGTLFYLFRKMLVIVKPGSLEIMNRTFGMGTTRRLTPEQVVGINATVHLDTANMTYYEIRITKHKGLPLLAGTMIPSKGEAEWLVDEIRTVFLTEEP